MKDLHITMKNIGTVLIAPYTNCWKNCALEHSHNFFEFMIPLSGYAENICCGQSHPLILGQIVLMRPKDVHEIHGVKGNEHHTHRDVYITIEKMQNICNTLSKNLYAELTDCAEPPSFEVDISKVHLLEKQLNLFNHPTHSITDYESLHTCIIYEILSFYIEHKIIGTNAYPMWIKKFISQLNELENMSKTIDELCGLVNYSRGHLCREFKRNVGKSVEAYLTDVRINHSYSLLLQPTLSLTVIATMLGYDSHNSFTRNFKSQTGITPSEWRKKHIMRQK